MTRTLRPLLVLSLLWATVVPLPAWAEWKSVQQVALGTAQVLEKGAGNFGIFAPLAYGITNRLTVETHPVYDLLLTVNFHARYRALEANRWVLSMSADYRQSFYTGTTAPGELALGPMGTFYLNDEWALTAAVKYAAVINPRQCLHTGYPQPTCAEAGESGVPSIDHGLAPTLAVHWLVTPRDLVQLNATLRMRFDPLGRETPTVTAVWVHDFGRWHLMAGATAGEFFIGRLDTLDFAPLGTSLTHYVVPVLPVLDAWFRF